MQDMIAKIVEMDEKARELTAEAQREKAMSEQDIAKAKEKIYNDFIERARRRIKLNEETERKAAEETWKQSEAKHQETLRQLEQERVENSGKWADEIVKRVLG